MDDTDHPHRNYSVPDDYSWKTMTTLERIVFLLLAFEAILMLFIATLVYLTRKKDWPKNKRTKNADSIKFTLPHDVFRT